MSGANHRELLDVLSKIEGKFLLSGYDNPLYRYMASRHGWYCARFNVANHAAHGASKRRNLECVWTNYDPAQR
jgi:hypothetical protein